MRRKKSYTKVKFDERLRQSIYSLHQRINSNKVVPEEIDFDTEAFYGHGGQPSCGFEESYGHMHDNDFGHDYDYDDFNDEEDY